MPEMKANDARLKSFNPGGPLHGGGTEPDAARSAFALRVFLDFFVLHVPRREREAHVSPEAVAPVARA